MTRSSECKNDDDDGGGGLYEEALRLVIVFSCLFVCIVAGAIAYVRALPAAGSKGNSGNTLWDWTNRRKEPYKDNLPDRLPAYAETSFNEDPLPSAAAAFEDLSFWPAGKLGAGVALNDALMPDVEKVKRARMYEAHAFEEYVSEMIPLERELPDNRDQFCRRRYGDDEDTYGLDKTSVIICFHNEVGF
jgi:hypothetical protein